MQVWTPEEEAILKSLYPNSKYEVEKIAKRLNRTVLSVRSKAIGLHITRGIKRWKAKNDDLLRKEYKRQGAEKCAGILGYSVRHITLKAEALGLSKNISFWKKEETEQLKKLCEQHLTRAEIAKGLNKNITQVGNKIRNLGLNACWWSEEEIEYLKANYTSHNADEIAGKLHRTKMMIYRKASELGITQKDNYGKNHYAFKEDKREYPPEWDERLRRKIRKRDNHCCQICNKTQEAEGIALQVHHIDYNKENNKESNLISLCLACHAITNVHRSQWELFFISLMKEKKEVPQQSNEQIYRQRNI